MALCESFLRFSRYYGIEVSASSVSAHVATPRNVIENSGYEKEKTRGVSKILRIAWTRIRGYSRVTVDFQ